MSLLTNHTYDEITIGQTASYSRTVGEREILLFAAVSGDVNPVHLDPEFAAGTRFGERIAHGMITGSFVSAALALRLPGPGTIYLSQSLRFRLPVKLGDTVTVELVVTNKNDKRTLVTLDCRARNQAGKMIASGTAEVIAPEEKLSLPEPELPEITVSGK